MCVSTTHMIELPQRFHRTPLSSHFLEDSTLSEIVPSLQKTSFSMPVNCTMNNLLTMFSANTPKKFVAKMFAPYVPIFETLGPTFFASQLRASVSRASTRRLSSL